jgi:hypothetical protein
MDPRHAAAHDAAHALVIAVHEGTRFWAPEEGGGVVRELRREALGAASAVVTAASPAAGDAEVAWALALLDRLEPTIERARERGVLDLGGATELLALRARARRRLADLEVRERAVAARDALGPAPEPAGQLAAGGTRDRSTSGVPRISAQ